jgi:hypothetical protein
MLLDSLLERPLEILRESLLESILEQLIGHSMSVVEDVGVIFGPTKFEGYAQEQTEDI